MVGSFMGAGSPWPMVGWVFFSPHHYQTWCGRCKVKAPGWGQSQKGGGALAHLTFSECGCQNVFKEGPSRATEKCLQQGTWGTLGILRPLVAKMPSMRGPGALNKCPLWGAQGAWKCPQWGGPGHSFSFYKIWWSKCHQRGTKRNMEL
jgi:hypothetical protein